MLFASTVFIFVFLPVVLLLYYTVFRKWRMGQNIMLLIASLIFYAWGGALCRADCAADGYRVKVLGLLRKFPRLLRHVLSC